MPSLRLFVALSTPSALKARLEELSATLQRTEADVRWEPAEKMHATVKFLGETPAERVDIVGEVLSRIAQEIPPFPVVVGGIGAFPSLRSPRVLWVGMEDPTGWLRSAQQTMEDLLASHGFARDERTFHPHVTLGRVRGSRNLGRLLAMVESLTFERQPVQLHNFLLIKSELKPHGSVYRTLRTAAFIGNQTHHR